MNNSMDYIAFKLTLEQSEFAGDVYKDIFDNQNSTFSNPLLEEVEEIYNQIINKYEDLTVHQTNVLEKIIDNLNNIRIEIDPNRLENFNHCFNEEGDLILYRNSKLGLINIIVYSDEDLAFSFIGNVDGNVLDFYSLDECDFENLVLKFLA